MNIHILYSPGFVALVYDERASGCDAWLMRGMSVCFEDWLIRGPYASRAGWCESSLLCCVPTAIYMYIFSLHTIWCLLLHV